MRLLPRGDVAPLSVILEPITVNGGPPPANSCGIACNQTSKYTVSVSSTIPDNQIVWRKVSGDVEFVGSNKGRTVDVKGNAIGDFKLEVDVNGSLSPVPYIKGQVLEKKYVNVYIFIVRKSDGTDPAMSEAAVMSFLAEVNKIYEQVAMEFVQAGSFTYIDDSAWLEVETDADNYAEYYQLQSFSQNTGGIEIYCINDIIGAAGLTHHPNSASAGITIDNAITGRGLAHELGHACELKDIYKSKSTVSASASLPEDMVKEAWLSNDWSGGTGTGYYSQTLKQKDLVRRLIMYGVLDSANADLALGQVYGVDRNAALTLIKVGLSDMNRQPTSW